MKGMKKVVRGFISVTMLFALSFSTVKVEAALSQKDVQGIQLVSEDKIGELTNAIDYEREYIRAKAGVSDLPITKEMLDACEASITDSNGNKENLNIYATVKKLGQVQRSNGLRNIYTVSVFASTKTDSGSAQESNTIAYGSVTWIDNFGLGNELVSVAGGWGPGYQDQLAGRAVEYGANTNDPDSRASKSPSENEYSYEGNSKMIGWVMFLDSTVRVNGNILRLRVVGSIFPNVAKRITWNVYEENIYAKYF